MSYNGELSADVCRCCLSKDCYKNMSSEYYFAGQKEVYEDLLRDTFSIQLSYIENSLNVGRFICDECINMLRKSHLFKQTVLRSEEMFIKYLNKAKNVQEEEDCKADIDIKVEDIKIEELETGSICEVIRDDSSVDDDVILANIKQELSKLEGKTQSLHTKKKTTLHRDRRKGCLKNEDCNKELSNLSPTAKETWQKLAERRGNGPIMRSNSLKLLKNSSLCVFQWNKSRYRCFCCNQPFSDIVSLKHHTNTNHNLEDIEKKIINQQNRLVKTEISELHCRICNQNLDTLDDLRQHLTESHDLKFELKEDLLVPFRLTVNDELNCQLCSQKFTMFRHLNIHMNKHFQKQVCHICGAGFSSLVFLNLHKTRSHRPVLCKPCNLTFINKIEKRDHDVRCHKKDIVRKMRYPCAYCHERFTQENFRVKHLVEKHSFKEPEHKCEICSKVFITKSIYNNHVKNVHQKEKRQECDICHHLFYTKSDVARHRVIHTGEKKFACVMCSSLFTTKDSLRRHVKRTHGSFT